MVSQAKPQILICDDDSLYHMALKTALKGIYDCRSVYNTDEAIAVLKNHAIDILLLDVQMRSPEEGLEALPKIREIDPELSIVMISGSTEFETVREAMRRGAIDYIPKDFNPDDLIHTVEQALERKKLLNRHEQQNYEVASQQRKNILIGDSPAVRSMKKMIDKFKNSAANVLITGETGAGKEVVARSLRGTLPDGSLAPFVAIDSATIQSSIAESVLFGYEKGAFTGAERANKGVFEEANGGIVYFDELGNMPLEIQSKLLRVLQEKEVTRLGSTKTLQLDFRVICATNRDLELMVKQGLFKDDLFQRLNVLPISIPPLRERKEDLPLLIAHFLGQNLKITEDAVELLKQYSWPGNIRELGNVVAFTKAMAEESLIDVADLPPKIRDAARPAAAPSGSFYEQVAGFEKELLARTYSATEGNVSKLALGLGMDRSHLYTKLREYGIHAVRQKN